MNRRARISALFVKDLRLLWPLGVLTTLTLLAERLIVSDDPGLAGDFLGICAAIASGLFLIRLVQIDSAASLRSEWLARPIGGLDLLVAKFLLAACMILVPVILGASIYDFWNGASVSESLLVGIRGTQDFWIFGFGLLLVAAVTETVIQTVGVALLAFLLFILHAPLRGHVPGDSTGLAVALGSFWVIAVAIALAALIGGLPLLWLAYAKRRRAAGRVALAATIALLAVALTLPRNVVLAIQRAAAPDHPAASRFRFDVSLDCFDTNDAKPSDLSGISPRNRQAGAFVAFATVARAHGLPPGWRMFVGDVQGRFTDSRGAALDRLNVPLILSRKLSSARHAWTIRRDRYDEMSRRATDLRLDYAVSLLEPSHRAEIAIDGKHHRVPGLGTCFAEPRPENKAWVNCRKAGRQPNLITARVSGGKDIAGGTGEEVAFAYPSFAPGPLRFNPGGDGVVLSGIAPAPQLRVTITAYVARAYVDRRVSLAGVIGGRAAVCRPDQLLRGL